MDDNEVQRLVQEIQDRDYFLSEKLKKNRTRKLNILRLKISWEKSKSDG